MLVTSTRLVLDNAKNEHQYTIIELKDTGLRDERLFLVTEYNK